MPYVKAIGEKGTDRNSISCRDYWQATRGLLAISRIAAILIGFVCLLGPAAQAGVSQDANGWTVFTPSPVTLGSCAGKSANGTCVVYVNTTADGGNDSTCAPANVGDTSRPCATITKGISLLRTGYPDWLLLKKGDSWVGGYYFNLSGKSSKEPMVISAYDPANPSVANPYTGGARPRLIVPTNGGNYTSGFQIQANIGGDNLAFAGLEFYASDRDPNNTTVTPAFNASTVDSSLAGLINLNQFSWLLVEDCKFSFFNEGLLFGSSTGLSGTLLLRRNLVLDSYPIVTGTHNASTGINISRITTPVFEENLFDHNGWNATVPNAGPSVFSHNLYISGYAPDASGGGTSDAKTLSIITFRGNIVARDAAFSNFTSGGTLDNNLWLLNPIPHNIGVPTATGPNLVTNNVYLEAVTNSAVTGGGGPQTMGNSILHRDSEQHHF